MNRGRALEAKPQGDMKAIAFMPDQTKKLETYIRMNPLELHVGSHPSLFLSTFYVEQPHVPKSEPKKSSGERK